MERGALEISAADQRRRRSPRFRAGKSQFAAAGGGFASTLKNWPGLHLARGGAGRRHSPGVATAPLMACMLGFKKNGDPISERSRELNAKIAELESRIK